MYINTCIFIWYMSQSHACFCVQWIERNTEHAPTSATVWYKQAHYKSKQTQRNEWIEGGRKKGKLNVPVKLCRIRCVHSARMHRMLPCRQRASDYACTENTSLSREMFPSISYAMRSAVISRSSRILISSFSCFVYHHRTNELLQQCIGGVWLICWHSCTHAHTLETDESERYRFNSLHFIGFYPASMTYDVYVG